MAASIDKTLAVSQTAMYVRMGIGLVFGLAITAGLFWMMQYMIVTADRSLNEGGSTNIAFNNDNILFGQAAWMAATDALTAALDGGL